MIEGVVLEPPLLDALGLFVLDHDLLVLELADGQCPRKLCNHSRLLVVVKEHAPDLGLFLVTEDVVVKAAHASVSRDVIVHV